MMLELNDVILQGQTRSLSLMAHEGQMTCLTGATSELRVRYLEAMMGFEPIINGFISLDGEPLTPETVAEFRRLMAYVPQRLGTEGRLTTYEPPSVQDVFNLKANRHLPISNGILAEACKHIAAAGTASGLTDAQRQLLAVGVLLERPLLLVAEPPAAVAPYLAQQAARGRLVVVTTGHEALLQAAHVVVEI